MDKLLATLFCCCARSRDLKEDDDETTPILPPIDQGPSIITYDSTIVDNEQAKERLNIIVRAKEGKMVNVLLRAPFNLRNEPLSSQVNVSSSRSGRSPSSNYNRPYNRNLDFHGGDLSRNSSPKPSPPISRSESTSSLRQGSLSHASATEDIPYDREPILKARLVGTSKGTPRTFNRRGRSRTRSTRLVTDTTSEGLPTLEGIQSVDSGRINVANGLENGNSSKEAFPSTSGSGAEAIIPLNEDENATMLALSEEISKSLENSLNLEDIGALSRGWGD